MKNILQEVEVRNYKRIRKALLTIEGNTLVISGENEAGKSSFLDAIKDVLGGKEQAPAVPIRKGAKEAVVITRLKTKEGRTLKATLTYTPPDHRRIVVTDEDGKPQMSPQALLSAFCERLTRYSGGGGGGGRDATSQHRAGGGGARRARGAAATQLPPGFLVLLRSPRSAQHAWAYATLAAED